LKTIKLLWPFDVFGQLLGQNIISFWPYVMASPMCVAYTYTYASTILLTSFYPHASEIPYNIIFRTGSETRRK
jgi:hypothetical protein